MYVTEESSWIILLFLQTYRLANIGHILNGMAGPIMYTAGPVISALWFPPKQRATATAISTVAGFAGNAACFLIG